MKKAFSKLLTTFCICVLLLNGMTVYARDDSFLTEDEIYAIAVEIGEIYNISPELLVSVAYQESRYKTDAVSGKCIGIMQVHKGFNSD